MTSKSCGDNPLMGWPFESVTTTSTSTALVLTLIVGVGEAGACEFFSAASGAGDSGEEIWSEDGGGVVVALSELPAAVEAFSASSDEFEEAASETAFAELASSVSESDASA